MCPWDIGQTIDKVLLTYADILKSNFDQYVADLEKACILMNNVQQMRVLLEKLFAAMGGPSLVTETKDALNDLQSALNDVIDELARKYVSSLTLEVQQAIKEMGKLLQKVT